MDCMTVAAISYVVHCASKCQSRAENEAVFLAESLVERPFRCCCESPTYEFEEGVGSSRVEWWLATGLAGAQSARQTAADRKPKTLPTSRGVVPTGTLAVDGSLIFRQTVPGCGPFTAISASPSMRSLRWSLPRTLPTLRPPILSLRHGPPSVRGTTHYSSEAG